MGEGELRASSYWTMLMSGIQEETVPWLNLSPLGTCSSHWSVLDLMTLNYSQQSVEQSNRKGKRKTKTTLSKCNPWRVGVEEVRSWDNHHISRRVLLYLLNVKGFPGPNIALKSDFLKNEGPN